MERSTARQYVEQVLGGFSGFQTKGLDDEKEFIDAIVDTVIYISENFKEPIPASSLPDRKEVEEARKQMAQKRGSSYTPRDSYSFMQVYLARVFMHSQNSMIFDIDPNNMKNVTLDGYTTCHEPEKMKNIFPSYQYSETKRETRYRGYESLTPRKKLEFKQELRKKVFAHEFMHASQPTKERVARNYELAIMEEIFVERMALGAEKISRQAKMVQSIKGRTVVKYLPNPESGNGRVYSVGAILSAMIGEEKIQRAMILGRTEFLKLMTSELAMSTKDFLDFCHKCDAMADKNYAQKLAKELGIKGADTMPPEEIRVLFQSNVENLLAKIYAIKMGYRLKDSKNISKEKTKGTYRDIEKLKKSVLTFEPADKKTQSELAFDEVSKHLDEICKEKGFDEKALKQEVKEEIEKEGKHYIIDAEQSQTLDNK